MSSEEEYQAYLKWLEANTYEAWIKRQKSVGVPLKV